MKESDIRLFNYIAKVAARKDGTVIAPNTFEGIGPVTPSPDDAIPEKDSDIAWDKWIGGLGLVPVLVWALRSLWKYLDPGCKRRLTESLNALNEAMKRLNEAASQNEFAAAAEALRNIFQALPKSCRDRVFQNDEFREELRKIANDLAVPLDELIGKYFGQANQDSALRWLVNYGTAAATTAAVYLWALNQPGGTPSIAAEIAAWAETNSAILWIIAAAAVVIGLAAALSGVGLPAGIASGATGVILMALLVWLNSDPPQNNGDGTSA
jgi:hypothetical protein